MKTYGHKETMNGAILQVFTDHDLVIVLSVGESNVYNITFLDFKDVDDLIKQLLTWSQKKLQKGEI